MFCGNFGVCYFEIEVMLVGNFIIVDDEGNELVF